MEDEQALNEENEITLEAEAEQPETDGQKVEEAESGEHEIVLGEEPSPVPYGVQRRLKKLSGQRNQASAEAEEAKKRAQALEEENRLLRLAQQQKQPPKEPNPDDFDTTAEYQAAASKYYIEQAREAAREEAQTLLQNSQKTTQQSQVESRIEGKIDEHYRKVAELNIAGYDELEAKAGEILGDDIARQFIASTKNSPVVMAVLGKDPAKAAHLKFLIDSGDVVTAITELGRLDGKADSFLKPKGKPAPEPEDHIPGGAASGERSQHLAGARFE